MFREDGTVLVDGIPVAEGTEEERAAYTVPEGHWFVLCDNRERCADIGEQGVIPQERVIGRLFLLIRTRKI